MRIDERVRRFVRIGASAYEDGSGFQAVVTADDDDGKPQFTIEIVHKIDVSKWPELKAAVERALSIFDEPTDA
jgi:hypothetical protein